LAVQVPVMVAAGVFVTDLAANGSRVCKFEVMGVTWRALTSQAGLRCDKREVRFILDADRSGPRVNRKDPERRSKRRPYPKVPKYQNPAQPSETWSGRGKPRWLAPRLSAGKKIDYFRVK
jgi:H-NS histone family